MLKKEIEEVKAKIERFKTNIADERTTADERKRFEIGMKRLEDHLATKERELAEEEAAKKKETPKKETESKKEDVNYGVKPKKKDANLLKSGLTLNEAKDFIKELEKADKKNNSYKDDFYEIVEVRMAKEYTHPDLMKPKAPVKKEGVTKKSTSKKVILVDGKEYDENSAEFCELLITKFRERREAAKKRNAKGKKTVSVMSRIAEHVEKGIATAIKTGVKENESKIEKNPKEYIKKLEKLEVTTKTFLQDLKDVLGDEYDAKEVTETTKAIHELVEKLKKSIDKK